MYIGTDRKYMMKLIVLSLLSIAAGFVNGLLGAGGGILFMFILARMREKNGGGTDSVKDDFATTIFAIFPISAVSASMYMLRGRFSFAEIPVYVIPAIAGGLCGAVLLDKIKVSVLKKIFAMVIIYSGINMLMR